MAKVADIMFSIHRYDSDGDRIETGVFLHFGEATVKASDSLADFRCIVDHLQTMIKEINENYYS